MCITMLITLYRVSFAPAYSRASVTTLYGMKRRSYQTRSNYLNQLFFTITMEKMMKLIQ